MVKANKIWKTPFKVPRCDVSDPGAMLKKTSGEAKKRQPLSRRARHSKMNSADGVRTLSCVQIKAVQDSSLSKKFRNEDSVCPHTFDLNSNVIGDGVCTTGNSQSPAATIKVQVRDEESEITPIDTDSPPQHSIKNDSLAVEQSIASRQQEVDQERVPKLKRMSSNYRSDEISGTIKSADSARILKESTDNEKLRKTANELSRLNVLIREAISEITQKNDKKLASFIE